MSWILISLNQSISVAQPGSILQTNILFFQQFTLLSDLVVCAELQSYIHPNEWAMNPAKSVAFTQDELIPAEAEKYAHQIIDRTLLVLVSPGSPVGSCIIQAFSHNLSPSYPTLPYTNYSTSITHLLIPPHPPHTPRIQLKMPESQVNSQP